jgi:hypothetical protein
VKRGINRRKQGARQSGRPPSCQRDEVTSLRSHARRCLSRQKLRHDDLEDLGVPHKPGVRRGREDGQPHRGQASHVAVHPAAHQFEHFERVIERDHVAVAPDQKRLGLDRLDVGFGNRERGEAGERVTGLRKYFRGSSHFWRARRLHPSVSPRWGETDFRARRFRRAVWKSSEGLLVPHMPFEHSSHGLPRSIRSTGANCPFGSLRSPSPDCQTAHRRRDLARQSTSPQRGEGGEVAPRSPSGIGV